MSVSSKCDICVSCAKTIKKCHKIIFCRHCKLYVHKKCTSLTQNELKRLAPGEWECSKCKIDKNDVIDQNTSDIDMLNDKIDVNDVDFRKYDEMAFDPLRYENMTKEPDHENIKSSNIECKYVTNTQLKKMLSDHDNNFTLLNANIRSIGKNLEKLILCLKTLDHKFTVIGLSETHLKDKPLDYYKLPGYNFEYTNRIGRQKGWGVSVCSY